MTLRFSLRTLGFCVLAISLAIVAIQTVVGPAVPRWKLRQISEGMTKHQVVAILGHPDRESSDHEWQFSRWGNAGWVEIWFNEDGLVGYINDESVFP
jgi:hypothetical protein